MESRRPALAAAVIAATIYVFTVIIFAGELPEKVASHFDKANQPNGWMPRSTHITFMLAFGLGVPLLILGSNYLIKFASPKNLNVPNPTYWRAPENFSRATSFMFTHSFWLAAGMWIWLTGLNYSLVAANKASPPHLNSTWLWILMVFFVLMLAAWIVQMIRFFKLATK